ncbi:MAG: hypothetical protein H0W62_10995 [Chitinophagales bacterium]|nr:hypothetical protein [Chitinophagales bacterium]
MKQLLTIFFALIYLTSIAGVTINSQYCFGVKSSVSIDGIGAKRCCCASPDASKNCCSHKQLVLRISDSHVASAGSVFNPPAPLSLLVITPFSHNQLLSLNSIQSISNDIHGPPLSSEPALFILHAVFRI